MAILGLVLATLAILLAFLYWLLLTEFSYISAALPRYIYDATARVYEKKWRKRAHKSRLISELFVSPLRDEVRKNPQLRVLDLACGTGRIPFILLDEQEFAGKILAVDQSVGMLEQLNGKLPRSEVEIRERIECRVVNLSTWQCDEPASFDLVTFLEASELVPNSTAIIDEVARAIKPGGLFVFTKVTPWLAWAFPGRCQRRRVLTAKLEKCGFTSIEIKPWRWRYEVVYARRHSSIDVDPRNVSSRKKSLG